MASGIQKFVSEIQLVHGEKQTLVENIRALNAGARIGNLPGEYMGPVMNIIRTALNLTPRPGLGFS